MARTTLQPVSRFAFLVVAAHVAVAALLWRWLAGHTSNRRPTSSQQVTWMSPADFEVPARAASTAAKVVDAAPAPSSAQAAAGSSLDHKSILAVAGTPAPTPVPKPLPKAIAIDPAEAAALMKAAEQENEQGKAPPSGPAPPPEPKVLDVSRFITVSRRNMPSGEDQGAHLEEVDRAIRNAFMSTWEPPKAEKLDINQRTAEMNMAVDRAGHVLSFTITRRSGSDDFDLSLREAADRLTSIHTALPASYRQDRYEFQLHFHVE